MAAAMGSRQGSQQSSTRSQWVDCTGPPVCEGMRAGAVEGTRPVLLPIPR